MEITADLAAGLIVGFVLGFTIGNYATSAIHRIPIGMKLYDRLPYCASCNTELATRDLFPIFSFLINRGKCRFCNASIPAMHLIVELTITAIFILHFLLFNYGETFLLLTAIATFLVILAGIEINTAKVNDSILLFVIACGALYRTVEEGSIFGFVGSGFIALMIGIALWKAGMWKAEPKQLPDQTKLLAMAGICLPLIPVLFLAAAYVVLSLIVRNKSIPMAFMLYGALLTPYVML
jgi:prepilin signal peptidase PulO-like enzyme (type II secretory pathway)